MTRDDYMAGRVSHQAYYQAVADAIGRQAVERMVLQVAPLTVIREGLAVDPHLNTIPLAQWDAQHTPMLNAIRHAGPRAIMAITFPTIAPGKWAWSLSETVSTLKAAARRMAGAGT